MTVLGTSDLCSGTLEAPHTTRAKGTMDHHSTTRVVRRRTPRAVLAALLSAGVLLAVPAAQAKDADPAPVIEDCRKSSEVKLKAEDDGGGVIKVSASVFSEDDDTWDWRLKHNDEVSYKGTVKAKDADRSFRIIRDMADFSGTDEIGFRAQNNATGEVCSVSIQY